MATTKCRDQDQLESTENPHSTELDLSTYTAYERNQLLFIGLYPLAAPNACAQLLHFLRFLLVALLSSVLFVSMVIALIVEVNSLSEVAEILYYLITQTAYLIKLANFMINRSLLPKMERHLKHELLYKYYAIFGAAPLESIHRVCTLTGHATRACVMIDLALYVAVPLVVPARLLPFAGWMPVDKVRHRGAIFFVQMASLFISAFTNITCDIYTTHYIAVGIGELRLLKVCLANVDYTLADAADNCGGRVAHAGTPKLSPSCLGELLFLHKHAIAYMSMVEAMFSYGVFCQFLASMCVLCLSGFQMLAVRKDSIEFVLFLFYCLAMMMQMSMYCYYGNEVMFESSSLCDACYMSNWYEGTREHKKIILLMMERSKRLIALSAGKFFFLSLTTFVLIVKTSYSYFAVLRRMTQEA